MIDFAQTFVKEGKLFTLIIIIGYITFIGLMRPKTFFKEMGIHGRNQFREARLKTPERRYTRRFASTGWIFLGTMGSLMFSRWFLFFVIVHATLVWANYEWEEEF